MALKKNLPKIDLSKASLEELGQIHNEVLRHLATRVRTGNAVSAAPYNSHESSHEKSDPAHPGLTQSNPPTGKPNI